MKKYTVRKNGIDFTIVDTGNDPSVEDYIEETAESPYNKKGSKIAELMMDYKTIPIFYGGVEPGTGLTILIPAEGSIMFSPEERPTAEICRRAFADQTGKDIYMIETGCGRVFYEACNDMPEKKTLYSELGATVTLEYRHKKNQRKSEKVTDRKLN